MGTDSICHVAFVGAGDTTREHVRAFAQTPGVELSGIFSRTRRRAEDLAVKFGIGAVCDSVAELFDKTRAELVVVTVSVSEMNTVGQACFQFPWTVLLEKPPGCHLLEAIALQREARARKRRVLVGLNRRFYSATLAALQDLKRYDACRYIHVQDQQSLEEIACDRYPQAVRDNWMYANSIHVIDYLRVFARGALASVTPVFRWNPNCPGIVGVAVDFEGGDIGYYEGLWNRPGPWGVSVSIPEKRWEMRPLEQATFQDRGERVLHSIEVSNWDRDFKPGFRLQAEHAVADAMGRPSSSVTLDDALETMRLTAAIFQHEEVGR